MASDPQYQGMSSWNAIGTNIDKFTFSVAILNCMYVYKASVHWQPKMCLSDMENTSRRAQWLDQATELTLQATWNHTIVIFVVSLYSHDQVGVRRMKILVRVKTQLGKFGPEKCRMLLLRISYWMLIGIECAGLKRSSTPSTAEHIIQLVFPDS